MAAKTAKKTATKKTTRKTATRKSTAAATATESEATPIGEKACAYPGCSARATQEFGDNNVPSCDAHTSIFETQAQDGAGIQQLMENYKG